MTEEEICHHMMSKVKGMPKDFQRKLAGLGKNDARDEGSSSGHDENQYSFGRRWRSVSGDVS